MIVLKAGRHEEGARAAASYTGALAGADAVHEAAFRRAGMLRVRTLQELFDAVEILARSAPVAGDRLAVVTNGGGFGVLATDAVVDEGPPRPIGAGDAGPPRCGAAAGLEPGQSRRPRRRRPGRRYADALSILFEDHGVDAILALNCPTAVTSSVEAARAVCETMRTKRRIPLVAGWVGDSAMAVEARRTLEAARLPVYETPEEAVRSVMHLVRYRRSQEALLETPPSVPEEFAPDLEAARQVIAAALDSGREWLTEPEAKSVLAAYRIPVAETRVASTVEDAVVAARAVGFPVVLKILSPDITHKSDVGGVALDLADEAHVQAAGERMLARVRRRSAGGADRRFRRAEDGAAAGAHELIVGVSEDAQFGPVVLFGEGGTAAEVIADRALALPPLNTRLAHDLMAQTRIHRLLCGYRDRPAADLDAVALVLLKVAQLVADLAEVELDINPLLADEHGVVASTPASGSRRPASGARSASLFAHTRRSSRRRSPRRRSWPVAAPDPPGGRAGPGHVVPQASLEAVRLASSPRSRS